MIDFLMLCHVAVFTASLWLDRRRGINRLLNLTTPISLGFLYTAVVQMSDARNNMALDLKERDLEAALWVSLLSYTCVIVIHWLCKSWSGKPIFQDRNLDSEKLGYAALLLSVAGFFGYVMVIHQEGGLSAYFGSKGQSGSQLDLSGYIYMMKFVIYGACALLIVQMAFRRLRPAPHLLLIVFMATVLWDAVKSCDRGDTIRAGMLWLSWTYFVSRGKGRGAGQSIWGITAMTGILVLIGLGVILLPQFRDTGRNILTSHVTLEAAFRGATTSAGASRYSQDNGGEIDTAARIIKRVNAGEFGHPGPVHIAHWMWNVVPRALLPEKHKIFEAWAGKNWWEVQSGSCSYVGCSATGSGEAYGMMGWFALLYWTGLGFLLRKLESWFRASRTGLIVSTLCYLPIIQLVMQDFWAGAMNASIVIAPVIVLLKWAQRAPVETIWTTKVSAPAKRTDLEYKQAYTTRYFMKITLTGVTGALNSGDQELCAGTIRLLQETFPSASIRGIHRNPELQAKHFPQVEWLPQIGASYSTHRLARRCTNMLGIGAAALGAAFRLRDCQMLPQATRVSYRALTDADLVVGCAGGWLEDHYVSIWTNLVHLAIATANGVPLVFAPQSIGPFNRRASRRMASWVLGRAYGIATREQISFDYGKAMGVGSSRLRLFPDLALFAEETDHEGAAKLLHNLCGPDIPQFAGTTLMPWSFPGSADPALELARYLDKVEAVIRQLHQQTGLKTMLLRQIRDDKGYQGDGGLLQKMASRTPDCSILCPDYLEPALLRGVIARCQVFWGSRMHSNIFAATQRVPVVTVAYQHKAEGIMRMLGLGDYVVWIDRFQPRHLVELIQTALAERDSLLAVLDSSLATIHPQWEELKTFMRESADVPPKVAAVHQS